MRGRRLRIAVLLASATLVALLVPAAHATHRSLGCSHEGCLPTPTDCATGAAPVTLGVHVGSAALCAGARGHTVAYAGGNATYPCGDVTVADRDVQPGDPNGCDGYADDPLDVHVYTPTGVPTAGLPSVYLLTGSGGYWKTWEDLGFDPQGIADRYRAVVIAIGGQSTFYVNWVDGTVKAENQFLSIVHAVDAKYGTSRNRSQRALFGFSMGGYGAMLMGERHPEMFGDLVSLSGVTNIQNPHVETTILSSAVALNHYAAPAHVNRIWGDPVRHRSVWRSENPTAQVCGLRNSWLWFSSGNGVPAPQDLSPFVAFPAHTEAILRQANNDFAAALNAHGLRFTYLARPGIHASWYWLDDMARVLPTLMHRLAVAAPSPQPAHTKCG